MSLSAYPSAYESESALECWSEYALECWSELRLAYASAFQLEYVMACLSGCELASELAFGSGYLSAYE